MKKDRNDVLVFFALAAFGVFYWLCPLDVMPGNVIDDFAVTVVLAFIGYKRHKQSALPSYNA